MRFPTKIPTILGIFLVVLLIGGIITASESYFRTATTASGSIQPENIQVSNVTDSTFSVSWTTQLAATGAISLSADRISSQVIFDDQDSAGTEKKQLKYTTHHVTFRGAQADTEYAVTVLSDGKKFMENGKPLRIRTGPTLTTASGNLEPAYGTIVTEDNQPVRGALMYITLEGGQPLSTYTKNSGTWLVPLNLSRTADLTGYLPVTERMTETITARHNGQVTTALTDTLNDSPVPDMVLGKTYDFRRANAKSPGTPLALQPSPAPQKTPSAVLGTTSGKPANVVALVIPAQGSAIPTALPLIQGTGIPGKNVSLTIGITKPIGGAAVVGSNGLWSYTPSRPLAAGKQSVTMTTTDINNKTIAITHMFEILKSGTQVLGDATPSATLTPTIAPTATPTAALVETPTPESSLAAEPPPTSGNELPTIILLVIGAGLLLGGGIVLIK